MTTDFGTSDHYVGAMKGVVLNICPQATIVDISHHVPSFDTLEGAMTLALSYSYFPAGTVHLVVVDPGVGSSRRAILASSKRYSFVAPDNGVLSMVFDREPGIAVRQIVNDRYYLHPVSNTFHGRDIFSPVAAHLLAGVSANEFGPSISDWIRLPATRPVLSAGHIMGAVIKIDKFGNVITNVTAKDLVNVFGAGTSFLVRVGELRSGRLERPIRVPIRRSHLQFSAAWNCSKLL